MVIASSLIEKITGKSLSRKAHLFIFVVVFGLCSCLLAWIDEHDRAELLSGQLNMTRTSFDKLKTDSTKLLSDQRNEFMGEANSLRQDVAVKEAVSQTLQRQNRDQQGAITGCLSQQTKLLIPEDLKITPVHVDTDISKAPTKTTRWVLLVNKIVTPVRMVVSCNVGINEAHITPASRVSMGGGTLRIAPNTFRKRDVLTCPTHNQLNSQDLINIATMVALPAWFRQPSPHTHSPQ